MSAFPFEEEAGEHTQIGDEIPDLLIREGAAPGRHQR